MLCGKVGSDRAFRWGRSMPSSIIRHPDDADDCSEKQAKREFERWRIAVDMIRHLREAGISCELSVYQARN